ncbi:MAG: RDD family protein [Oscillochloridaceae bacterium umkhey_bin13]
MSQLPEANTQPPRGGILARMRQRSRGPQLVLYAGFISRMVAMIIDLLIIGTLWVTGGIMASFIEQTSGLIQIMNFLEQQVPWLAPLIQFQRSPAFEFLVLLVVGFSYFTFLYALGGITIGKGLLGLRVVSASGRALTSKQAALRTLAYVPSALIVYLGFLNVLLDNRRRGWHDKIARTAVIHSWNARPDETFLREAIERVNLRPTSGNAAGATVEQRSEPKS